MEKIFEDLDALRSRGLLKVIRDSRKTDDDDEEFEIVYHGVENDRKI